jgi:hypothetical protein
VRVSQDEEMGWAGIMIIECMISTILMACIDLFRIPIW